MSGARGYFWGEGGAGAGGWRCSNPSSILFQPAGRGVRLPEVFCIISCLGCFGLFSKVEMWWL